MSDPQRRWRPRWWPRGPVGGPPLPLDEEQWVDRIVARGLYRLALVAILSIAAISLVNSLLQAEILTFFDPNADLGDADPVQFADEAISVLGNIAAAGVGALAGWLSRGMFEGVKQRKEGSDGSDS